MAGLPTITEKEGGAEGEMAFDATFEVYPEVKIGDLSAVEIEKVARLNADRGLRPLDAEGLRPWAGHSSQPNQHCDGCERAELEQALVAWSSSE